MTEGTERGYQSLAAAIVEAAAVDYVDALIKFKQGYLSTKEFRSNLYRAIIHYGKNRFVRIGKENGKPVMMRQDERKNMRALTKIKNILEKDETRREALAEIKELERFFKSERFNILMPHTDSEVFMNLLREKAEKGERVKSIYSRRD